ncbi:hypothetical protein WMF20_21015 [Sorangium sp. So ce834]|uniref:hypothetical protein n=1 Tax=Sorangium sp. So ce834 TaxID=3133321 RepID=UPI003F5E2DB8
MSGTRCSIPERAREAIEVEAADAAILEVRMEIEEDLGEAVYEADIRRGRRTYALRNDGRGTLIARDITMDMLPPGAYWALPSRPEAAGSWSSTRSCTTASSPMKRTS